MFRSQQAYLCRSEEEVAAKFEELKVFPLLG